MCRLEKKTKFKLKNQACTCIGDSVKIDKFELLDNLANSKYFLKKEEK
jgi:hypothetical protein